MQPDEPAATCGYDLAWLGPCQEPPTCIKHGKLTCTALVDRGLPTQRQCKAAATRQCPCAHQFVCGRPLCDYCKCGCCPAVVP